jgi:hypothetical protein
MNPIKKRIANFLKGDESCSIEQVDFLIKKSKEIINIGIENDADALIYTYKENKKIFVVGVVGRSFIHGTRLHEYLDSYFADSKGLKAHLQKIVQYIYEDTTIKNNSFVILREPNSNWRSFRPIKTIDDFLRTEDCE